MDYYLYFSPWQSVGTLPDRLNQAKLAFESGKMVTVIFGIESSYYFDNQEWLLALELPIDWVLLNAIDKSANKRRIESRLKQVDPNSKVVSLAWDQTWIGSTLKELEKKSLCIRVK